VDNVWILLGNLPNIVLGALPKTCPVFNKKNLFIKNLVVCICNQSVADVASLANEGAWLASSRTIALQYLHQNAQMQIG